MGQNNSTSNRTPTLQQPPKNPTRTSQSLHNFYTPTQTHAQRMIPVSLDHSRVAPSENGIIQTDPRIGIRKHYGIVDHFANAFWDHINGHFTMRVNPFITTPKLGLINDYAFLANVLKPGHHFVVMVTNEGASHLLPSARLGLGFTSRDPHTILACEMPKTDPNELLDRPEYWVIDADAANGFANSDEFCISFEPSGEILMGHNGGAMRTLMHVDTTISLWVFFILLGSTTKLLLRGKTNRPIAGFQKAPKIEITQPKVGVQPFPNLKGQSRDPVEVVPIRLRTLHPILPNSGSTSGRLTSSSRDSVRTDAPQIFTTNAFTPPFRPLIPPLIRNPPSNPFTPRPPPLTRNPSPASTRGSEPTTADQAQTSLQATEFTSRQDQHDNQPQLSRRGRGRGNRRPNRSRGHHGASGGRDWSSEASLEQDETNQQDSRGRGRRGSRPRGNGRGRGGSRGAGGFSENSNRREGDWTCPDEACANSNFAWRVECYRCGIQRPDGGHALNSGGRRGGREAGGERGGRRGGRSGQSVITIGQPMGEQDLGQSEGVKEAECIICCDKKVDSVFLPCGHMCMDMDCATTYWRQQLEVSRKICPICRADSTGFIRTFTA